MPIELSDDRLDILTCWCVKTVEYISPFLSRADQNRGHWRIFIGVTGCAHTVIAIGNDQRPVSGQIALDDEDGRKRLAFADAFEILRYVLFIRG